MSKTSTPGRAPRRSRSVVRPRFFALLALTLAAVPTLVSLGPAEALNPDFVGPRDPGQHGFPAYYTDDSGVELQMCDDGSAACGGATNASLAPAAGENFYWMATADMSAPGLDVSIEFAAEAAWANRTTPITFDRLRIRGHADQIGTYTVTHPYGTTNVQVTDAAATRNINFTDDVGCEGASCNFAQMASAGQITNWITSTTPPAGRLGDGVTAEAATMGGEPASVSVTGPAGTASTTNFVVTGKLANPNAVYAPKSVAFGLVRTAKTRSVRVKNLNTVDAAGPYRIGAITVTGSAAFRKAASTCTRGLVLAVGASCTVGVKFRPTAGVKQYKGVLHINDSTPSGGRTVNLRGR
jgi:hypothetical protein